MAAKVDEAALVDGILDSLEDVGYSGPLFDDGVLLATVTAGLESQLFIELCVSLCEKLKGLLGLSEAITPPQGPQDSESFYLEMRAFLVELCCPHTVLTQDLTALDTPTNRLLLIDFLLSELLSAHLISLRKQQQQEIQEMGGINQSSPYDVARNLEAILQVFGIKKPPPHVNTKMVFDKIIGKTREVVSSLTEGHLSHPLVVQPLTSAQWATVDMINDALTKEYSIRRKMLLTRCDVTVQSFMWSDKGQEKEKDLSSLYESQRDELMESSPVLIARVLSAKQDLTAVDRTSSGEYRLATQCAINKVLIGSVPDRGGRPRETRPPPEMPSFKQRVAAPQERRDNWQQGGRRGGRGGRGGGGGGRVQGGWGGGGGRGGRGGGWDSGGGGDYGGHGGWDGGGRGRRGGGRGGVQGGRWDGGGGGDWSSGGGGGGGYYYDGRGGYSGGGYGAGRGGYYQNPQQYNTGQQYYYS